MFYSWLKNEKKSYSLKSGVYELLFSCDPQQVIESVCPFPICEARHNDDFLLLLFVHHAYLNS